MADTPKRTVKKGEDFWREKEALAASFEAGEDVVAKALAVVNAPAEAVVES
jgi:hypothetical protein